MSEAGQIDFPPESVTKRGRIEAGGMICFDHNTKTTYNTKEIEAELAAEEDYTALLAKRSIHIDKLPEVALAELPASEDIPLVQRYVAYGMNQESFRLLLDPMIENSMEKVTAMGYGVSLNALNEDEGGMSKYFSQRFAQVTNPPLDSIREKDGMTLRVALGAKPNFSEDDSKQIVIDSPVLQRTQLEKIYRQSDIKVATIDMLYTPAKDAATNEQNIESALESILAQVEQAAADKNGIIVLTDKNISIEKAAFPFLLAIAAANQHLIEKGMRFNSSLVVETGQIASSHDVCTGIGFGASAVCPLTIHERAKTLMESDVQKALSNYQAAIAKSLMKIMGKFGFCTAESYIGGEIFESNYLNTKDPNLETLPEHHFSCRRLWLHGNRKICDRVALQSIWH